MAKKAKIKRAKIPTPKTVDDITKLEQRMAKLLARKQREHNALEEERLAIVERQTKLTKRYNPRILEFWKLIGEFVKAHETELREDGKSSFSLSDLSLIKWYTTPFGCDIEEEKMEDLVSYLERNRLNRFVRYKKEVDKDALLKERDVIEELKKEEGGEGLTVITFSQDDMLSLKPNGRDERLVWNLTTNRRKIDVSQQTKLDEPALAQAAE